MFISLQNVSRAHLGGWWYETRVQIWTKFFWLKKTTQKDELILKPHDHQRLPTDALLITDADLCVQQNVLMGESSGLVLSRWWWWCRWRKSGCMRVTKKGFYITTRFLIDTRLGSRTENRFIMSIENQRHAQSGGMDLHQQHFIIRTLVSGCWLPCLHALVPSLQNNKCQYMRHTHQAPWWQI